MPIPTFASSPASSPITRAMNVPPDLLLRVAVHAASPTWRAMMDANEIVETILSTDGCRVRTKGSLSASAFRAHARLLVKKFLPEEWKAYKQLRYGAGE